MLSRLIDAPDPGTLPLQLVTAAGLPALLAAADPALSGWVGATGWKADPGTVLAIPGPGARPQRILAGIAEPADPWLVAALPTLLPEGSYRLEGLPDGAATDAAIAWALAGYRFARYRKAERPPARLVWPEGADRELAASTIAAAWLVRDLVNTPANDLGPAELAEAALKVAAEFGAEAAVVEGAALAEGFPMVATVGRASSRPPRLVDLRWGAADAPRVTLVGKGVCFDSGGLDLKPSAGMLLMKKDMGGAAHALALGRMVMAAGLPVRLRVLIPCVENAVAGDAFRPLDVLPTRAGLTVEIGNTDAEGRLILCDALTAAVEEQPALVLDFSTLTGAARVALGPELPAMFSNDEDLAAGLLDGARRTGDPMWRLPLWQPYAQMLKSSVADINNAGESSFAGAITAALYLQRFVPAGTPWAHFDLFAWNAADRPGRPKGGEAMTLRACFAMLQARFAG